MADNYTVTKVELNKSGVIALLQSESIMQELEKVAEAQLGEIDTTFVGFDRCHVICKEN